MTRSERPRRLGLAGHRFSALASTDIVAAMTLETAAPPTADGDVVLRTVGLTKRYGSRLAIDHLTIAVRRGRVYGFLGPNGSGKTTTIALALGLIAATEGYVELFGLDTRTQRTEALAARRHDARRAVLLSASQRARQPASLVEARRHNDVTHRRSARARRVDVEGARQGAQLLARHEAAAGSGGGDHASAGDGDPRRADERARPGGHPRVSRADPLAGGGGRHGVRLQPHPGRGRADVRRRRHPEGGQARRRRSASNR